jgi:hypothetical protein
MFIHPEVAAKAKKYEAIRKREDEKQAARIARENRHIESLICDSPDTGGIQCPHCRFYGDHRILRPGHHALTYLVCAACHRSFTGGDVRALGEPQRSGKIKKRPLSCEIKGLKARGYLIPNGFLVLQGSYAVLRDRPSSEKYPWPRNMRQRLRDDGVLAEEADHLIFTRDAEFSSPSAAAAVIHGGHANGLTAWKDEEGNTLKAIEMADQGLPLDAHQEVCR